MAYIKALSYYLPIKILTNEELVKDFPEWSVEKVAQKVGVNTRHIAGEKETACDMAEKAARKLFKEYNINQKQLILYFFVHKVRIIFFHQQPVFYKTV